MMFLLAYGIARHDTDQRPMQIPPSVKHPITYGIDGIRALMLGQDVMTVFNVTAFAGLWNTVLPAVTVLLEFNLVLGGIAVRFLKRASKAEVQ